MKDYLLIFRGGGEHRETTQNDSEAWQAHMQKWKTWMENLDKEGKFVGGQPLGETGSVITGTKKVVTDGPFAEGSEVVAGYLIIKAGDQDEAVKLSKDCPLLEHNGIVEVREIQELKI